MTSHSFHSEAETELQEGVSYYEGCSEGLGLDFALEVHAAVQRIREYPTAWPVLERGVRRCQTKRFPYGVVYSIESDSVLILAIMHLHRRPDYWQRRL